MTAFYHDQEERRKEKKRFLTDTAPDSLLCSLLKAVEVRDIGTVLNCLEAGCDINENITVGSNVAALYKPWSQFIIGQTLQFPYTNISFFYFRDDER